MKIRKSKILNGRPFGYKNTDEIFQLYVTPRFEKLEKSLDIGEYYDYINAVGLLFNWITNDTGTKVEEASDTFRLFKALYNNIKHHDLDARNDNARIYVYEDYDYILKCRNGLTTFNENGVWNDKVYWHDDCSFLGDSGELVYILKIKSDDNLIYNACNQIYLYELCKKTYNELSNLFQIK